MDINKKYQIKFKYQNIIYVDGSTIINTENKNIEIEDEDKVIFNFVNFFKNPQTVNNASVHFNTTIEEIKGYLIELDELGIFEKAISNEKFEKSNYRTNLAYFENFTNINISKQDIQDKLSDLKVAIFGIGGSSLLLKVLAGMGIKNIKAIDYDIVESSNLSRQYIYSLEDIGRLKTEAAKDSINKYKLDEENSFQFFNQRIESYEDVLKYIDEVDIVINTIDSPPIESVRYINKACLLKKVPYIFGGLTSDNIFIDVYDTRLGECFECNLISGFKYDKYFIDELKELLNLDLKNKNFSYGPNILLLLGMVGNILTEFSLNNSFKYNQITLNQFDLILNKKNVDRKNFKSCTSCGISHEFIDIYELLNKFE